MIYCYCFFFFFFQAEDGIRDWSVTGVQACALPICEDMGEVDVGRRLPTDVDDQARALLSLRDVAVLWAGRWDTRPPAPYEDDAGVQIRGMPGPMLGPGRADGPQLKRRAG